tara:strand:- start:336 stop:1385 length:1050 start_codon:yes stop_codon:yes gene_type:complete
MSHNWKNILVSPSLSIQDVIIVINEEALQLALVVDCNNKLLGTVTDGDIRRALIQKISLSSPISEIMFKSPTTAQINAPKNKILELMREKELSAIPLIDNNKVVGIETLRHLIKKRQHENPVFLMAGGFGTRLKPLTDNCPKPLLKVGDKPILETVLLSFISHGFSNFYISTHYLPEMIEQHFGNGERWGVSITYIFEEQPLGTGGALGLLPKTLINLPIIVINGDVLTTIDFDKLLTFHNDNQADATMCVREFEYQVPYGVVESEGHKIKTMVEKPIQRFHVNAGIYVISKNIIEQVKENESLDMPSLFEKHIKSNVLVYPFYDYWLDIGRIDDFNRAQLDIKTLGLA